MRLFRFFLALLLIVVMLTGVIEPVNVYAIGFNVFILSDSSLLCEDDQAPVDINNLKSFYENDGYTVTLINKDQFTSSSSFNANICDLLVLPYGPKFPLDSIDNYKKYVREGGKTLSLGGYAFSRLNEDNSVNSLSITAASSAQAQWRTSLDPRNFSNRTNLKVSVWMKTEDVIGNGFAHSSIYIFDSGGNLLLANDFKTAAGTTDWTKGEYTFTVPSGAATLQINLGLYQAAGTAKFDKVMLTDSNDNTVLLYDDFDEGIPSRWQQITYSGTPTFQRVNDAPSLLMGSNHSMYMTATEPINGQWRISLDPRTTFVAGESYKLSFWMKAKNIQGSGYAYASVYNYNGSTLLNFNDFYTINPSSDITTIQNEVKSTYMEWRKIEYSFTAPSNATKVDILFGMYNVSGMLNFDKVQLTRVQDPSVIFSDDFEGTNPGQNWQSVAYTGSADFGISGDAPVEPDNDNKSLSIEVQSRNYSEVQWQKNLNVSAFTGHTKFKISAWTKIGTPKTTPPDQVDTIEDGVQTANYDGYAYDSIYFYDANNLLLGCKDFKTVKSKPWEWKIDWERSDYYFELPAGTATVQIGLGLYKASAKVFFDNIMITAQDNTGAVIMDDRFDSGIPSDWHQVTYSGSGTFGLANQGAPVTLGSNTPYKAADWLSYDGSCMPIFDMPNKLKFVKSIVPADNQSIFSGDLGISDPIEGYSAVTWVGNDRGRWQPLINAKDKDGQIRGTVGAVMHLYPQPSEMWKPTDVAEWKDYLGSSIAFFGVTNKDLMDPANTSLRNGFKKLTQYLINDVYLEYIDNKFDCYKQGEHPEITVYVGNGGKSSAAGTVHFEVTSDTSGQVVYTDDKTYTVDSKMDNSITTTWSPTSFDDDFYKIQVILKDNNGNEIDRISSGFSVWNQAVVDAGPKMNYSNNYIDIMKNSTTSRSIFATGTDDGANLLVDESQTPLVWKEDMKKRLDAGIYIYEQLQQYRNSIMFKDMLNDPVEKEKHFRKVDNIVYLSQKYKQIYMMGVAIGNNVADSDASVDALAAEVQEMAVRYKDVPGLIYYLNGDMGCILSDAVKSNLQAFLTNKYAAIADLNAAWGTAYSSFDQIPVEDLDNQSEQIGYSHDGNGWFDKKINDYNMFRADLIKKWTKKLDDAIKAGDTTSNDNPVLCEYYQYPMETVDIPLTINNLTYSNMGWFENFRLFPKYFAYSDTRERGKSFGVGEYGKKDHPLFASAKANNHQSATSDESMNHFFQIINSAFTMGANHVQTWSWKDEISYNFPWGTQYTDGTPRDLLYWFRNTNLFYRQMEPVYTKPEVGLILPDNTRNSGNAPFYSGHWATMYALDRLQASNVGQIGTLDECALSADNNPIDSSYKVLFYPVPYNPSDTLYNKLKTWIQNGGVVYISGDFCYDDAKQRNKGSRLSELAGVNLVTQNYLGPMDYNQNLTEYHLVTDPSISREGRPGIKVSLATATALYQTTVGDPVIVKNNLGLGKVIFSTDPLEFIYDWRTPHNEDKDLAFYKQVLSEAGINPVPVSTTDTNIRIFELPLKNSYGTLYNLSNYNTYDVNFTISNRFYTEMKPGRSHLIWVDGSNNLKGVFNQGIFKDNDITILENAAYAHVFAKDSAQLIDSKQIIVLPQKAGHIKLKNTQAWANIKVLAGQVVNSNWVDTDTITSTLNSGYIEFDVTDEQASKIILIVEDSQKDSFKSTLVNNLTNINY